MKQRLDVRRANTLLDQETTMKMVMKRWVLASLTLAVCASARPVTGQERNLYWGDTHVHTSYSFDAYRLGNVTVDPETAYRFAKGLPVVHPATGNRVRLERPIDFLVVADHTPMGREGEAVPFDGDKNTPEFQELVWSLSVDAAERNNEPGHLHDDDGVGVDVHAGRGEPASCGVHSSRW